MSLINKMLRDLDARHASTGKTVLPNEVRPLPAQAAPSRVGRNVLILAGLAVVAVAALQTSTWWLPAPVAVAPAPPPLPATVVLQLPPPEQMLPLPSLPEIAPTPPEAPTEQAAISSPTAREQAQSPIAESRNTGLKIDSSLPDVPVAKPAAPVVASQPKPPTTKSARAAAPATIEKQQRLATAQERAEAEYRKGVAAYKQGHSAEAATQFKAALQEEPRHLAARQTLLSMQAEQKQWEEVQSVLKEGLDLMPEQIGWAMALARIQVERGKLPEAWETLQRHMVHAEKSADYQGFAGVLLQRMQKPHEATLYYQAAVQLKPNEGRWWLGLGLALEADNRTADAREAFQRARSASGLTPEMAAVIDRKLR